MTSPDARRAVPRTDAVLADPRLAAAAERLGRERVKQVVSTTLGRVRAGELRPDDAVDDAMSSLADSAASMRRVINATGVVLHTNLGRAPLSPAARSAVADAAGYVDVEFDLATGERAKRGRGALGAVRRAAPDAEAAHVVNNGAAALLLAVATLAGGREVVISRGELVEIGDGFRLPDLIEAAGVRLREVGTTNRVALDDYAAAMSDRTAAVLKIHPSNFSITGFTGSVDAAALAGLGLPLIVDTGSGLLAPHPLLPDEPDAATALRAGATLVTCSGDKLLGGPQAGLLLGKADAVERARRHPFARAVRVDKLTLAALEATLAGPTAPSRRYLELDADELRGRCEQLLAALPNAVRADAEVVPVDGVVGGGGAPGVRLPGWAIALPERYADALRRAAPPVVGRIAGGRCLLDLRCVADVDDALVARAVVSAAPR